MLKINLLPIRQLKKRNQAQKQLLGLLVVFLCVLALLAATAFQQKQNIDSLQNKIASLNAEKSRHAPTLKKIEQLKKDIAEFNRKTEIINKLRADSSLTVRVLDEVANRIDNQRMWLASLRQQHSSLRLTGTALDNQTIAQFMDVLKESPFVQNVNLTNSTLKVVSGRDLKSFQLVSSVSQPVAETPATANPQ